VKEKSAIKAATAFHTSIRFSPTGQFERKMLNSSLSLLLITIFAGVIVSARNLEKDAGPVKVMMSPPKKTDKQPKGKAKLILDKVADYAPDDDIFDIDAMVDKLNKESKKNNVHFDMRFNILCIFRQKSTNNLKERPTSR
jgi:hypothetical protein